MQKLTLKPCSTPDTLVSLRTYHSLIAEVKRVENSEQLKLSIANLQNLAVQYAEMCSATESAALEFNVAMKDREARRKKHELAEKTCEEGGCRREEKGCSQG